MASGRQARSATRAAIIGAGMAGASAAHALARLGVQALVLDRRSAPAQETSGNTAGLFHGVVHGADGVHARWLRAAALRAHHGISPLVAQGRVTGRTQGLLRGAHEGSLQAMRAMLEAQALPAEWAEALAPDQATKHAGVAWSRPAWLMHAAGWVSPPELVGHWLATPGVQWQGGTEVHSLRREQAEWQLLDATGRVVATAEIVVLANAADAVRLLGQAPGPWERQRGQVSEAVGTGHQLPLPLADGGYAIDAGQGRLLFGATSQTGDDDPSVRDADHLDNLASLRRLTGWALPAQGLVGRTGWRMQTEDRLPWIGPVPLPAPPTGPRRDQPRFAPRHAGLYLLAGLGSRGLTHAPLAGELLAAWITGLPMPVPSRLIDAVDPARHAARAARQPIS
jgi:tRNA 5-methylaminomethyl-2-thiouridine biosynthesis bifunctional protein